MTDKKEPMKVEFMPGCFDSFEGTQEELEAFQQEIMGMFANMSPEELAARSVPLEELSLDEQEWALLEADEQELPIPSRGKYLQ